MIQRPWLPLRLAKALCWVFLGIAGLASISFGSSGFGWSEFRSLVDTYLHHQPLSESLTTAQTILWQIRLPRALVAALCGSALAAAGVLSQGLFRNPLASPSVLGTEAGGGAAAAIVYYLSAAPWHWLTLPLASCAGAFTVTMFILVIVSRQRRWAIENLLLAGFAINAFLGALTSLVLSLVLEDYLKAPAILYWLMGGLTARGWEHLGLGIGPIALGLLAARALSYRLNVLALGEDVAATLSISLNRLKQTTILVIALLVGTAISIAGAIPFVGLIVPHITRLMLGPEHRQLLLYSVINGATLLLVSDLVARTIRAPEELQVGVLIAMVGAPFFLTLLVKGRHRQEAS